MAEAPTGARGTVAAFLLEHRDAILHAWEAAVRSADLPVALEGLVLRNSIPVTLDELADWIESGEPPGARRLGLPFIEHAQSRLAERFDLRQVLVEYRLLREAILRVLVTAEQDEMARGRVDADEGRRDRVLELARLHAGIDVAIADSVEWFVEERERRAMAEREWIAAQQEWRLALAEALRPLGDTGEIQSVACRLIAEHLPADRAYYLALDEDEGAARVSRNFVQPGTPSLVGVYRLASYEWVLAPFSRGETVVIEDAATDPLIPDAQRPAMEAVQIAAHISVPVHKDGALVGAFCVTSTRPRRWSRAEVDDVRDATEKLWASIVRARAEAELRASAALHAYLLRLGDALRPLGEPEAIEQTATRLLGDHLEVDRALYCEVVGEPGAEVAIVRAQHVRAGSALWGRFPLSRRMVERHRTAAPVVVHDARSAPGTDEADRVAWSAAGIAASVAVSLVRQGRIVASLAVHHGSPRRWSEREVSVVRETAERTWDAVERAQAEQAVRASDRHKSEFLAVLSHELRNPLAPIRNSIYLLDRVPEGSDAARRTREVMRRQTDHLTRLVDDLLDVTRISRGKIELRRQRLDVRELVAKAVEDTRAEFERADLSLHLVLEPDAPVAVDADATRLAQVIGNVLQNARKFTPAGGHVTVRLERDDDTVRVRIEDTGAGMEPGSEPAMFEAFAQGHQGVARTQGGLGLGLALVKALVEMHGGRVWAHSGGPWRGTEVVIELPRAHGASTEARPRDASPAGHRDILVVEDNPDAATTLADLLGLAGHEVRVAADGRTALAMALARRPDVILCDVGLPDIDGYTVARMVRGVPRLADVRLIALTGYASPEDRARARAAGFDAHLAKPPEPGALLGAVGALPG